MRYLYSALNQLEKPHTYMYAPYEGYDFLHAYVSDRLDRIDVLVRVANNFPSDSDMLVERAMPVFCEAFQSFEIKPGLGFEQFIGDYGTADGNALSGRETLAELADFSVDSRVCTRDLMQSLIEALLINHQYELSMPLLNRLIQRYEVTKKLYTWYIPGFRKGEGPHVDIFTYWQFSFCLALAHTRSGHSRYLSTLLKVIDLLLSLPANEVTEAVCIVKMKIVVAAELFGVLKLASLKVVSINVD